MIVQIAFIVLNLLVATSIVSCAMLLRGTYLPSFKFNLSYEVLFMIDVDGKLLFSLICLATTCSFAVSIIM